MHCIQYTSDPPPYTTIPLHSLHSLHPLRTATTVSLTIYHYSTAHCIHCIHCLLVWPFCTKDNVPTTIYHYSTAHCVHWYCTHCVQHPLHTASTVSTACMAYIGNLFTLTKCPPHPPMLLVTHENHYKPKSSHFQPIPKVPSTNQKSAKNLHFFHCMTNLSRLGNSSSHQ